MRNTFINTLVEAAREHEDIFLLCGDLGYSVLELFANEFPDRFLNVGIAEQNMTQIAAGLALEGYNVFTYSIGNFPTLRCMEQIRYDVCYHQANVKVVAVGAGYAYGPLGTSHHTTEDLAMMRALPGMLVTAPGDACEAAAVARLCTTYKGPGYVRINKAGEPKVHKSVRLDLKVGQFLPIRSGRDVVIVTTGAVLEPIAREVEERGLPWAIVSMPFVSHMDEQVLAEMANTYDHIITVEEHQLNGGFGSALLEKYSDLTTRGSIDKIPSIYRIGISNEFQGYAGSQNYLRERAGIGLGSVMHLAEA
jgi:transketolase